jgi:hypothetical protein
MKKVDREKYSILVGLEFPQGDHFVSQCIAMIE